LETSFYPHKPHGQPKIYKASGYSHKRIHWDWERVILTSPNILSENNIPPDIDSRDKQLEEIGTCFGPITEGRKHINCWLCVKPGTGKTATAHWIFKRLEGKSGIQGVYVNCWENPTFFSVLECIARELRMLGAEKLSTSFKLDRLKRHISNTRLLLAFDKIDVFAFCLPYVSPARLLPKNHTL